MLVSKPTGKRRRSPERRRLTGVKDAHALLPRRWRRRWLYAAVLSCMLIGFILTQYHTTSLKSPISTTSVKPEGVKRREDTLIPPQRIDTSGHIHAPISPDAQYLSYLPHGGFHTQRIALENALTLCRLLDRTLLLPPLWIGRQSKIPWQTHLALQHALGNTTKSSSNLAHCQHDDKGSECNSHYMWSQVGWDWMVDVGMGDVDWVDRRNFTEAWLYKDMHAGGLGLKEGDVHRFEQAAELDLQIVEDISPDDEAGMNVVVGEEEIESSSIPNMKPSRPYTKIIKLSELRYTGNRLLQFDSLAGSNRLQLYGRRSRLARNEIRSTTVISNDLILAPAKEIASLLSNSEGYVALDARIGGHLESSAGVNMRAAWWELGRRLGVADDVLEDAEREVWARSPGWREAVNDVVQDRGSVYPPPPGRLADAVLIEARSQRQTRNELPSQSKIPCPRLLHTKASLLPLNTPLFISVSLSDPHFQPALRLFYSTFPCTFTLDTPEIKAHLEKHLGGNVVNDLDGYVMRPWLTQWIGAEVAARAVEVVGTHGTAWAKWAEEMVQPIARGWVLGRSWKPIACLLMWQVGPCIPRSIAYPFARDVMHPAPVDAVIHDP